MFAFMEKMVDGIVVKYVLTILMHDSVTVETMPVGNFFPTSPSTIWVISPEPPENFEGLSEFRMFFYLAVSQMCLTDVRTKSCPWKLGL